MDFHPHSYLILLSYISREKIVSYRTISYRMAAGPQSTTIYPKTHGIPFI